MKQGRPVKFTPEQRKERARLALRKFRASNAAYRQREALRLHKNHVESYVPKKQTTEWQEASRLRKLARAPKGPRIYVSDPNSTAANRPEYNSWHCARLRCTSPLRANYAAYGGRGISFSPLWLGPGGFQRFLADVGKRPSNAHTLHRPFNNGGYRPGNAIWSVDHKEEGHLTRYLMPTQRRAILASIPPYLADVA